MKYIALAMMAALSIITLFGFLPEAHAGSHCYIINGKMICCYSTGNVTNCF